jgi:Protein of unknown function (DUF732)
MVRRSVCRRRHTLITVALSTGCIVVGGIAAASDATADETAYLVNVTVRPGYHFASAQTALSYGRDLCAHIHDGRSYAELVGQVKRDLATTDEFQGEHLVSQAVNELCPAEIWNLRQSASNYRGSGD